MRYDIAIIGSGPAGLSAAINAKIRNKTIIMFGNDNLSNKLVKAPSIDNYLGFYDISGDELKDKFKSHIDSMDISIENKRINNIYAMGEYFTIMSGNDMYEATTVILATGVEYTRPIKGEEEFLGRGVGYCATCDAPLYRNKKVAVQIDGDKLVNKVSFKENHIEVDGVFVIKDSTAPSALVPGIEIDGIHIKVDNNMKTSIDGCFAAGDCVGKPYSYIKAAGQGQIAALNAVYYLDKLKRA